MGVVLYCRCLVGERKVLTMPDEFKPCPFCGGRVYVTMYTQVIDRERIQAECAGCRMTFDYEQHFAYSRSARVPLNDRFVDLFNHRVGEGEKG